MHLCTSGVTETNDSRPPVLTPCRCWIWEGSSWVRNVPVGSLGGSGAPRLAQRRHRSALSWRSVAIPPIRRWREDQVGRAVTGSALCQFLAALTLTVVATLGGAEALCAEILAGLAAPLTGQWASGGEQAQYGAELAMTELNAEGGLL